MPRPVEALIHTEALARNLRRARTAAPGAKVWAVVKANAYGHGITRVFDALRAADGFALLDLHEAELVRSLGWRGPILLLEGCFDGRDLELCSRLKLWHVVHASEQIDRLAALKTDRPHHVFLKMNSGMNRLGFRPDRYRAAWLRLDALPQVEAITLMTPGGRRLTWQPSCPASARCATARPCCGSARNAPKAGRPGCDPASRSTVPRPTFRFTAPRSAASLPR